MTGQDHGRARLALASLAAIIDATIGPFPDTGHFSMRERPREVAALLAEFAAACD